MSYNEKDRLKLTWYLSRSVCLLRIRGLDNDYHWLGPLMC